MVEVSAAGLPDWVTFAPLTFRRPGVRCLHDRRHAGAATDFHHFVTSNTAEQLLSVTVSPDTAVTHP